MRRKQRLVDYTKLSIEVSVDHQVSASSSSVKPSVGIMFLQAPMQKANKERNPNHAKPSASSPYLDHATQGFLDIDTNAELLNCILSSWHADQSNVARHHYISHVEATESDQLLQGRAALEDTSNDSGVNPVAEADVDVLEQRIRLGPIEDVDEGA